jgi:hypothetical protein
LSYRPRLWLALIVGASVLLVWAAAAGWPAPITAVDVNQHRANTAIPAPQETSQLRQTFTAGHDGLTEIELLLVQYDQEAADGRFELQLLDDKGDVVSTKSLEGGSLKHNQNYALHFPPQAHSAGRQYTLLIGGTAGNDVSAWGYDVDVHSGGRLGFVGGETAAEELRFVTRYRLTLAGALASLASTIRSNGLLLLLALAFMLMPGRLLFSLRPMLLGRLDPAAAWGIALALGLSIWPLLWLWLSLPGGRWAGWSLWLLVIFGWAIILTLCLRRNPRLRRNRRLRLFLRFRPAGGESQARWRAASYSWHHAALLGLLLLGLAVRLLAVRDLAFPPWVDASRHALITAVMANSGQVITDYAPYLAVDRFPYHFGFHTVPASIVQMTGVELPRLLLHLGQLLNALVPLSIYAAAYLLTRRRGVSLFSAFLVALPFFFPAYYATWGRMTQLTAMLMLPVVVGLTWRLVRGARLWRKSWWLLGVLVAGLFLVHFRLALLYLPFAALVWLLTLGRRTQWLVGSAALALALVSSQILRLAGDAPPISGVLSAPQGYNDFPVGYVTAGWEQGFWWLFGLSLLLAILAAARSKRWALPPLFLAAWMGLSILLLAGDRLDLPVTWLINLNSAYISAFLPVALVIAIGAGQLWRWLTGQHWSVSALVYLAAGACLAAGLLFGIRQQITILNAQTILAESQDLEALEWLEEKSPPSATIAVSSWRWLGRTWAGSDGGAWIVPQTGRNSTTPPADYVFDASLAAAVNAFNVEASAIEDWSDPGVAAWLEQQGVSHLFVGARGGFLDPSPLSRNPALLQEYAKDGAFVFSLVGP